MHRTYQAHYPPGPSSSPPQQDKVILQREYREKEGECFTMLRDVIKDLTGKKLRTRQEILKKAIDILLTASEIRKQREAQTDALAAYETPPLTNPEDTTSAHVGHFTQSLQSWPSADFDAASPYYGTHFHDQLSHFMHMSGMDTTFSQASSPGYGEDWSNYPQFGKPF